MCFFYQNVSVYKYDVGTFTGGYFLLNFDDYVT
jgi:hypothetical protein